jgi:hypothetical protein
MTEIAFLGRSPHTDVGWGKMPEGTVVLVIESARLSNIVQIDLSSALPEPAPALHG